MESRDVAEPRLVSTYQAIRPKMALQLDPSYKRTKKEETESPSPSSTDTPLSTDTPSCVARHSPAVSDTAEGAEDDKDTPPSKGKKATREKKKRSRVTPEQLVHLEKIFTKDRSPTAARRREISEQLGMQERQTQIWFQNRRAKAKLVEGKAGKSPSDPSPHSPPKLSSGFQVDLHSLIHEDEPVTMIPCNDLSIGTWRRIVTTFGRHDLVAYVCESKRRLSWFIQSGGSAFKMDIPFDIIIDTEFSNSASGSGLASFTLGMPPQFFIECIASPRPDGTPVKYWKRCQDWTEDQQASHVLRHDLIGSAAHLANVIRSLQSSLAPPGISLHVPEYMDSAPPPRMELPPPPLAALAGLTGAKYGYSPDRELPDTSYPKRSLTGPPMTSPLLNTSYLHDASAPTNSFTPSSFNGLGGRGMTGDMGFGYQEYRNNLSPLNSDVALGNFGVVQADIPEYSSRSFEGNFFEEQRLSQNYNEEMRRHSSASYSAYGEATSPPLLTTPYHPSSSYDPPPPVEQELVSPIPVMSGLSTILHDPKDIGL